MRCNEEMTRKIKLSKRLAHPMLFESEIETNDTLGQNGASKWLRSGKYRDPSADDPTVTDLQRERVLQRQLNVSTSCRCR